jgi:hypothetical protein
LIGSAGVSGPFGSGCGAGDGLGSGCCGGLGAGTSANLSVTFGSLLLGYENPVPDRQEASPVATAETGQVTGTKDKTYNIIWFTEACLDNVLRLEQYIQDAERENDSELAEFFRKAQETSRRGGERGKELLKARLGA